MADLREEPGRQPRRQGRPTSFIEGLNGVLPWTFDG